MGGHVFSERSGGYTGDMLDRDACERRVYRLAALLTGNPLAATSVIAQVIDAQPDLSRLDGAHMDRLTVLRSREIPAATLVSDIVPQPLSQAVASLTPQQREAYAFVHVFRTPLRETSRAMDCSTTAVERHLHQADQAIAAALGPMAADAPRTLLAYAQTLDVPPFYRQARDRRRRIRKAIIITMAAAGLIALLIAAAWVARWLDRTAPADPSPPADSAATRSVPP